MVIFLGARVAYVGVVNIVWAVLVGALSAGIGVCVCGVWANQSRHGVPWVCASDAVSVVGVERGSELVLHAGDVISPSCCGAPVAVPCRLVVTARVRVCEDRCNTV